MGNSKRETASFELAVLLATLICITLFPCPTSGFKVSWVPVAQANFTVQEAAGHSKKSGEMYYVGRAEWNGGVVVGYYAGNALWFAHDSSQEKIAAKSLIQVLQYKTGDLSWVKKTSGDDELPFNILLAGLHPDRSSHLYICRASHEEAKGLVGWVDLKEDTCNVCLHGSTHQKEDYEMLVLNFYGIMDKSNDDDGGTVTHVGRKTG